MKVLLVAINAKYIHSSPAIRSLQKSAGCFQEQVELLELTINHQPEKIFYEIYRRQPDLLCFSCYIWNRREIREAAQKMHMVRPDLPIWAGGPEVSWDAEDFLSENPGFTGIMLGEGEETFGQLLQHYIGGTRKLEEITGITWRDGEKVLHRGEPSAPGKDLDALPFLYQELSLFENKIIYYESSRGCPFSCSYCMSSLEKSVRLRSLRLVLPELEFFLQHKVPQVKFVDRTFNCNRMHTREIWTYLLEHDNQVTNFHFELSADLLNKEELELISRMRPGLAQFEIGVQSTNLRTLEEIHRTAPFEKIAENVRSIAAHHNVHLHLDLIAGLPYEGYESFARSFDMVYDLRPQEFQLGFLKVLRGSEMHRCAEKYGILYSAQPPYEVLQTRWLSCGELLRLKDIEEMLEVYYNSRQFDTTIELLLQGTDSPFTLYEELADYYIQREGGTAQRSYTRLQRAELLRDFARKRAKSPANSVIDECLLRDLYLREKLKTRPAWALDLSVWKEAITAFYKKEEKEHSFLPDYQGYTWKQLMGMTHLERTAAGHWELYDYQKRDPLTYAARCVEIE